jgi:threonine/homoserine/homoserine lactone efflux protein
MTFGSLLLFAAIYAAATATPGPGIAALVARVMAQGLTGIWAFIAGFLVGDLIWFALAATGLAVIAQRFEWVFMTIRYAGVVYLVYLAYRTWTAPLTSPEVTAVPRHDGPGRLFLGALALTLGNPKVIIFFLSIMPLIIDVKNVTTASFLAIAALIVTVFAPVLLAYALLADQARRLFRSARAIRLIHRGTAGIMLGAALAIASR